MGVTIGVSRHAVNTSTGNQTFTNTDLGGLTPKAAMFFLSRAPTDGTPQDQASFAVGFTDGTRQQYHTICSEDAQATTDTYLAGYNTACIRLMSANGAADCAATFVSFGANAVTINWSGAPDAAYTLTVILFAGTDLSAYVGNFYPQNSVNTTRDVTGVGFQPDVLFVTNMMQAASVAAAVARMSLGVVVRDGSYTQRGFGFVSEDAKADSSVIGYFADDYGSLQPSTAPGISYGIEYNDFDADGFSATTRVNGAGFTEYHTFLALKFNGAVGFAAGHRSTPTSTGNEGVTTPAFTPQLVLLGLTQMPVVDTGYNDANAGSFGLAAFDSNSESCSSYQDEDNQADSDTQSLNDAKAVNLPLDSGSAGHVASFVSLDANGWTLNWTTVTGTAKQYWWLAIEGAAAPAARSPVPGFCDMSNMGMY